MDDRPTITRVEPRGVEIKRAPMDSLRMVRPLPEDTWRNDRYDLTAWEKVKMYTKTIPHLFTITRGLVMKDWKTTLTGAVGAVCLLITSFTGYEVPLPVQAAIVSLTLFGIGYFAGDSTKG